MFRHTWRNLVLAAMVLALGSFLYLKPEQAPQPTQARLTQVEPNAIERIVLERPRLPSIALEKQSGKWQITEPVSIQAKPFQVQALLRLARSISHAQYPTDKLELERFGLKPARAKLHLNDHTLEFGDTDPIHQRRYVRSRNHVHLIDEPYPSPLQTSLASFVSPKLLPEGTQITELELPGIHVTRNGQGSWLATPTRSVDSLQSLIDTWQHARALEVQSSLADPPAQPDQTRVRVRLLGTDEPLEFTVVQREPELVLARDKLHLRYHLVFEMGRQLLGPVTSPPDTSGPK